MTTSTDAKLVFGIQVEEDSDAEQTCNYLMQDRFDELEAAEEATGAKLTYHCSDSFNRYIVGVRETCAHRGYPEKITSLKTTEEDLEAIEAFCNLFNIPFDADQCAWWLCSYWG